MAAFPVDALLVTGDVLRFLGGNRLVENRVLLGRAIVVKRAVVSPAYWPDNEERQVSVPVENILALIVRSGL